MMLKPYQDDALNYLEKFCTRVFQSNSPSQAFEETTQEWFQTRLSYHPLSTMPDVPYVCLRIPTGGGKTLIGGLAIERVNKALLHTDYSLTLWLVPTEPIKDQTLRDLKTTGSLLHSMLSAKLSGLKILTLDEAIYCTKADLVAHNVIIVSTMQSFKQEETSRLNVYKENGQLMSHFEGIADRNIRGNHSLVDVIRMHRPFIIVDEAHNQGTSLAFDTLARFSPSMVLELTATPDREQEPSNVLYSVSAAALRAAEMIKLPLELMTHQNYQDAVRDAIACLANLQNLANEEQKVSGEYLRPIMLLQAERRSEHEETFTAEKVKTILINDFQIKENEIAISIGEKDELSQYEDVLSPSCPVRFIITVDKLREGWNCPFAYVLCTFRPTTSRTAVEQILGRILRMPYARKKGKERLNLAYAFATSPNFQSTAESLKDGLVKSGFQRQTAEELIRPANQSGSGNELFEHGANKMGSFTFETPELPNTTSLSNTLKEKIEVISEAGTVTIRGTFTSSQEKAIEASFQTDDGKKAIRNAFEQLKNPPQRSLTPSENGESFIVPILAYHAGDLWEEFEETHLLEGNWNILDNYQEITEAEFPKGITGAQRGQLNITEKGEFSLTYGERLETQLALFETKADWNRTNLVSWLERNLYDPNLSPDEKAAFLNRGIEALLSNRGFPLEELVYRRFRLRPLFESKIKNAKNEARKRIYQQLILKSDFFETKTYPDQPSFKPDNYDYNFRYTGFTVLPKHFYPVIGDLKERGEEFHCAKFLAVDLDEVEFWIRNVERKATSWSLQTSTDRFYPDFICKLKDGRILVVEYKNERDWDLPDNQEKRILGDLWEKRSNKKCLFIMPKGEDFDAIRQKLAGKF